MHAKVFNGLLLVLLIGLSINGKLFAATLDDALLENSGLNTALFLAPVFIESETQKLHQKKFKLSRAEIKLIQQKLLARFHTQELTTQLETALNTTTQNDQTFAQARQSLNAFYNSALATELRGLLEKSMHAQNEQALLDYHHKLATETPQAHRLSIVRTWNGLNHYSNWQAMLFANIQQAIANELNPQQQKLYTQATAQEHKALLAQHQEIVMLYAFRAVAAENFIPYFDTLAQPAHQNFLLTLETLYQSILEQRTQLDIRLSSSVN